jgi:hypothetical protein
MRTLLISSDIRDAMRSAGFNWRPYLLRPYFATAMTLCESKGLITHEFRQFFMGHAGDIERVYSLNKTLLPDTIEAMRESYAKCLKYLETEQKGISEDQAELRAKNMMLALAGFKDEEIQAMKDKGAEELSEAIRKKLLGMVNNGHRQKVVKQSELKHYIEDLGWEFVKDMNTKEAIVRLPS